MKREDVEQILRHTTHLAETGMTPTTRAAALAAADLVRVRGGWYAAGDEWAGLFTEGRHLARVLATAAKLRSTGAVFSHVSAAVLWGLPLYRHEPRQVHTTLRHGLHVRSADGVARHRDRLDEVDVVHLGGTPCTGLARTVLDVARSVSLEAALAAADAAFRMVAWDEATHSYDLDDAGSFRREIGARIGRMPGRRGIRQARWVVELADGRAQLPGESISRLRLLQAGFASPRLQVEVPSATDRPYYVDFGLDDVRAWGEFDGAGKYADPELLNGRTTADAVMREKQREDWIRLTTDRPIARWTFEHLASPLSLLRRLHLYGIFPPR